MAPEEKMSFGFAYPIAAFLTGVVLVVLLANCVCAEKKQQENENGAGATNTKHKSKKLSKKSKKQNGAVCAENVELGVLDSENPRNSNTSNGSVATDSNGTRPKSHDGNRALPEIPNGEASYDKNYHPYATVPGEQDSQTYAAVSGNSDFDPDYAGISTDTVSETYARVKDTDQAPNSAAKSAAKSSHPYAEVSNIGEATYAQISEKPHSSKRKTISSTVSSDTIDSTHVPPVPDKNLDALEPASNGSMTGAGSPNLPPRNSVLDSTNIPYADEGSPQHQMYDVSSVVSSQTSDQGPKKKEPPYDDITARESLSHMRERQAKQESRHVTSAATSSYKDVTYDREYDEIKSVPAGSSGNPDNRMQLAAAGDRNSLASDTYAEIWQSDQTAFARQSSLYSRVQDMDTCHAPTPPPIDTLKQLSHTDGVPGGLSRQRPMSALSTTSSTYHTVADIDITTPATSQPLYAVPQKRNKRQTVHGDINIQSSLKTTPKTAPEGVEHLYSQVDKAKKKSKKKRNSNYDNIEDIDSFQGSFQGARPKDAKPDSNRNNEAGAVGNTVSAREVDQTNHNSPKSSGIRVTPGYQTIGSVENYPLDGAEDDPDYDTVQDGAVIITDDVDYESLPGSAVATAARVGINVTGVQSSNPDRLTAGDGNANPVHLQDSDPNANQDTGAAAPLIHISQHQPRTQAFARREHIYEVITDKSHENIYTADPTRHVASRKSSASQRQIVTNL